MEPAGVPETVEDFREGRYVIVADDAGPAARGYLAFAADCVTPDAVNFLARHGRGLIGVAMTGERLDELDLPPMVSDATETSGGTSYTVSVEARHGTTTGISAHDRARTIEVLIDAATRPEDLARPGHMFPIRTVPGGVLVRPAAPEAVVDLARLAGRYPAAVLCAVINEDGTLATPDDLAAFAADHGIRILSIEALVAHRRRTENFVRRVIEASVRMPTKHGHFQAIPYRSNLDTAEHIALIKGDLRADRAVLTCVHVQCLAGDVFGDPRCGCENEIGPVLRQIEAAGQGVLIYLRRPVEVDPFSPGQAALAPEPAATAGHAAAIYPHDYAVAARILADLGVGSIRLLSNDDAKPVLLQTYGITVVETVPIGRVAAPPSESDIDAKRDHLADLLGVDRLTGL